MNNATHYSSYRAINNLAPDVAFPSQRPSSHGIHSTSSSTGMAIEAGRGIGPFSIGMDIGAALVIASQYEENPRVIVDRSSPFIHDTLLDLPNLGFRLCFDGYSQRLHVVIVNLQPVASNIGTPTMQNASQDHPTTTNILRSVLNFSFNNIPLIRSARCPPDLRHVYRVCGPTIPGHYSRESPQDPLSNSHNADSSSTTSLRLPSPDNSSSPSVYYHLKYPGLAFRFPVPYDDYEALQSSDEDLLPFVLPISSSRGTPAPIVDRLFLFPADSPLTDSQNPPWLSPSPILPSVASCSTPTSCEDFPPTTSSQPVPSTSVDLINHETNDSSTSVPGSLVPKQRYWNVQVTLREGIRFPCGGSIHFGAALQDVYAEVGAPDRVTLKDVDVIGIMSSHADFKSHLDNNDEEITSHVLGLTSGPGRHGETPPADYFCNYFFKGFDLLVCGGTHRVKKIILHTNFPGHVQFGDYTRCFFSISLKGPSPAAIDVDSSWNDIERYLGTPSPPLLVDYPPSRQSDYCTMLNTGSSPISIGNPATVRKFYGYPGMAIEVFDKKWVASITLF